MAINQDLVDEQVYSWTEMYKKSAISFLVLAALATKNMWSKDIGGWIRQTSGWEMSERSLYRVLRRMEKQGSIEFTTEPVARTGAERKVFALTSEGEAILNSVRKELSYLLKAL